MQRVLVLDSNKNPLMPCYPARARQMLKQGKAAIFRRFPFTIILKDRDSGEVQPVALKIDPCSKITGVALVGDFQRGKRVLWAGEINHRGKQICNALLTRRQCRYNRRYRHTRYRPARFNNRRRPNDWLPPSIQSRVDNITTWAGRLYRLSPLTSVALELAKFDTQVLQNPEIDGVEYQQGTLHGYEIREYLLEKWGHRCAYCGRVDVPLEVEHITPRSRGGSNRVSNLTLACKPCNQYKGNQTAAEFGYPHIQRKAKQPLKDAAVVNATRWTLYRQFEQSGLPLEVGTGGQTKYNRRMQDYPKAHWIDAACVGASGARVYITPGHAPLVIRANGHQSRLMCRPDKYGFPRTRSKSGRVQFGFQTGDMVRAIVDKGKKQGVHIGRVAVRSSGKFNITTHRYCTGDQQSVLYPFAQIGRLQLRERKGRSSPCLKLRGIRAHIV